MSNEKTDRIRALNDLFRQTSQGGQILMTHGVSNFNPETIGRIAEAVKNYNDFSEDNDPYGEHDFGSFEIDEHKLFWKIERHPRNSPYANNDRLRFFCKKGSRSVFLQFVLEI